MLEAHVGISTDPDARNAGRSIVKQALEGASTKPKLGIFAVDCMARTPLNYNEVLEGIREELGPDVPLMGSQTLGLIVNDRFVAKSTGIILLGGDLNVDATFNYGKSRLEYEKIAGEILRIKSGLLPNPNQLLLLYQDGMCFPPELASQQRMLNSRMVALFSGMVARTFKNQMQAFAEKGMGLCTVQELVETLYDKGWDIPIIGNCVVSGAAQNIASFGGDLVKDFVMGAILTGTNDTKFGCGFGTGGEVTGVSCNITKNIGSFLLKINDKPAIKGFCDALGIEKDSLRELSSVGYFNHSHLLGTSEKVNGREIIHACMTQTNPDLENMIYSGFPFDKVPEKVDILRSSTKVIEESARASVQEAMKGISEPKFLIGIDCAMRFLALGDNIHREIAAIRDTVGKDVPRFIIGSGTEVYGTQPKGYYGNNYTLVSLVGGR